MEPLLGCRCKGIIGGRLAPMKPRRIFRFPRGIDPVTRRVREEVDDEVAFHLERRIERLRREGYSRA